MRTVKVENHFFDCRNCDCYGCTKRDTDCTNKTYNCSTCERETQVEDCDNRVKMRGYSYGRPISNREQVLEEGK